MTGIKKKNLFEILLHLVFWVGVFYTQGNSTKRFQIIKRDVNGVIEQHVLITSSYSQSAITLCFFIILFYSNAFWLLKKVFTYKSAALRFALIVGWNVSIFIVNYFVVLLYLQSAGRTTAFWGLLQLNNLVFFLFILGTSIAYFFSKEWIKTELLRKQMEAYQLSTEIKFLKSQINPHFLFNTLNNLFSMAQGKGNDELADGISKLSGMMRYMIYESNAETVPLKNEIEYIKSCIALNKLRYADDEAQVNFNYPQPVPDLYIAPMIFIPFIENAFKHGVTISEASTIDISIAANGDKLSFTCMNGNHSFIKKMTDEKSGIGLENVKRRLELLYAGKNALTINNNENTYSVELKIDLS